MYSTEDTHHFPAYGVAPDYWAQRALGSNHQGQPLALAPNFATERLLASESLLREREHATARAERRNASREKQLSDHTVKLEEHRAQLEAAHASLLSQQATQKAKAVDLRRWEAGLLQREENLKLLLSSPPQGGQLQHGGQQGGQPQGSLLQHGHQPNRQTDRQAGYPVEASSQVSLDCRLGARAAADGARSPQQQRPQQQRPQQQRPMPPQAQAHDQRSRLQSLKSRVPPPQLAAGAASPFFVRSPRASAADTAAQEASPQQDAAGREAEEAAAAAARREAEERAREAAVRHAGVAQAEAGAERAPAPAAERSAPAQAAVTEGPPSDRPRSRQLPPARASYAVEADEGVGPVDDVGMVRCSRCSRSFAEDRIEAHERACQAQSTAKPRQVFDSAKARAGDDAQAVARPPRPPKEGLGQPGHKEGYDWKAESENVRALMKYNRELAAAEKAGRDISTLPPPPKPVHDDRVACPHCDRKFKADVAERHIPKCNSRPK